MITWGVGNSDNTQVQEVTCGSNGMGLDEMTLELHPNEVIVGIQVLYGIHEVLNCNKIGWIRFKTSTDRIVAFGQKDEGPLEQQSSIGKTRGISLSGFEMKEVVGVDGNKTVNSIKVAWNSS